MGADSSAVLVKASTTDRDTFLFFPVVGSIAFRFSAAFFNAPVFAVFFFKLKDVSGLYLRFGFVN